MNRDIMRAVGFSREVDLVERGLCPSCSDKISLSDFKNDLGIAEFKISGLCQSCQDTVFGGNCEY